MNKKELQEKIYSMSNSFLPLDMFYNDIRDNPIENYDKEQAYKDIEKIANFILDLQKQLKDKDKRIAELEQKLAELKEKAIVPRFKYKDYVYAIYSDKDIFKGQIDIFDYYTKEYLVFFSEDIGNDWFSANSLFATEQEAQDKLKEMNGNE